MFRLMKSKQMQMIRRKIIVVLPDYTHWTEVGHDGGRVLDL